MSAPNKNAAAAGRLLAIEVAGGHLPLWSLADYESELQFADSRLFWREWGRGDAAFVIYRGTLDEAWILHLAVERKSQGRGKKLLTEFLESLPGEGYKSVGLEVSENNVPALRLYRSAGFTEIGRRAAYYRNGDTAVVMRRQW
ncbi:MAG: GNAT family N-acetyltransferase [Bdellovibrionales bacterium]|nr:GNAT family N-acetyltransferase [Bdellovibrionales bacterium]